MLGYAYEIYTGDNRMAESAVAGVKYPAAEIGNHYLLLCVSFYYDGVAVGVDRGSGSEDGIDCTDFIGDEDVVDDGGAGVSTLVGYHAQLHG